MLLAVAGSAAAVDLVFGDGFESGGVAAWSSASGYVAEEGRMVGMTAAHNAVRDATDGGAAGPIPPLSWSPSLAAVAEAWAEHLAGTGCELVHSNNAYGENLFWGTGLAWTPQQVVAYWASEEACYTYGRFLWDDECTSDCDDSGGCGHYTQIVWRDTTQVGCGMAECPSGAEIWCCNYDPPGNFIGEYPY
jgi:hypothetical protein